MNEDITVIPLFHPCAPPVLKPAFGAFIIVVEGDIAGFEVGAAVGLPWPPPFRVTILVTPRLMIFSAVEPVVRAVDDSDFVAESVAVAAA